ncbi:MAG: hypothetical protein V1909_06040 [Candidatus Micrarchaeota archaeon]
MKLAFAVLGAFLLLLGCIGPEEKQAEFALNYKIIGPDGVASEGAFGDTTSVPKNSAYFHIRATLTNVGNVTHYLRVLDQEAGPYKTSLPLYARVEVNGLTRDWRKLNWSGTMGIEKIERESERLVSFAPGEKKELEAPIFFFNGNTVGELSGKTALFIEIVNASGNIIGEKSIMITLTD